MNRTLILAIAFYSVFLSSLLLTFMLENTFYDKDKTNIQDMNLNAYLGILIFQIILFFIILGLLISSINDNLISIFCLFFMISTTIPLISSFIYYNSLKNPNSTSMSSEQISFCKIPAIISLIFFFLIIHFCPKTSTPSS